MATLERLNTFTDSPTINDGEDGAPATSRIQVAKLGKFRHPSYGTFTVTREKFDALRRNLSEVSDGEAPMDFDHLPDRGGSTAACGWIKALDQSGEDGQTQTPAELWATVEWLDTGAEAIRTRAYRYISPTIDWAGRTDDGAKHGPTLIGAALTNRPFFDHMAAVSLSQTFSADDFAVSEELDDGEPEASDSRPRAMEFTANIATTFGLAEDASEETILAKATDIAAASNASLDDRAKAEGKVLLSTDELASLKAAESDKTQLATRLETIEAERADEKFDALFAAALNHKAGAKVAPAEKDELRKFFDASPEAFAKSLELRGPIVNGTATGARGEDGPEGEAPRGVDPDAFALDQKVQAFMREHTDHDYTQALAKVRAQGA